MNQISNKNEENKDSSYLKQKSENYGYDPSYISYATSTTTQTTNINQPLPGQPPLPPMPPPTAAVPPPPSVFAPVPSEVTPMHTWTHTPTWQWITPQPSPMPTQTTNYQREMPIRNNFIKRDRFNYNRNNVYSQRDNNFHRKNRRRFDNHENQYSQASYFGAAISNSIGIDWQQTGYTGAGNEAIINQMQMPIPNFLPHMTTVVTGARRHRDNADQDNKEEVVVKKNKQRKPMSQSYPSRPWNRESAERALKIESEFNKTVKAQSLIIKFPDPDLNKDIVRKFHPDIQNIHFQSPSGPRYCFIQMAENVNVDEAIQELEKIPFGTGYLKVERKSLRDEDNPVPEEIDPYTLYIGNLPESVNVNEVKSKFPTAARVDVGFAQKMRNTRYAFIRYNSVDESIEAFKNAHDLMWDTRSIIVRFRRQRGNTCLPGEPKSNIKKNKSESSKVTVTLNSSTESNEIESKSTKDAEIDILNSEKNKKKPVDLTGEKIIIISENKKSDVSEKITEKTAVESHFPLEVKDEPEDYEEIDEMLMEDDDDDDDDDDEDHFLQEDEDISNDEDENIFNDLKLGYRHNSHNIRLEDDIPSDHLDKIFSDLENMADEIGVKHKKFRPAYCTG